MTGKFSSRSKVLRAAVWLLLAAGIACAQTGGEARVMVMTGQVTVLRDGATWAINTGEIIHPDQMIITGADGYAQFRLADGSSFEVFQNARVAFRDNRGDWRDLLEILLGKVKIQIEHLGGANPNRVRTPTAVIAVRGTVFDVDVQDADATTMVLCVEGRVEVTHLVVPGKSQVLNPGDAVTVFKNQPLQARGVDRGVVAQKILRAFSDAANQILLRGSGHSGTTTASTTPTSVPTTNGDKSGNTPTGPPPAPPPPPPPH